jgi:transposase
MSIGGVGEKVALTWVLEVGDPGRFSSIRKAVSYCGLCSGQRESGGKEKRGPISKQRNKHLQSVLIEAAKLAPMWNSELAEVYARESARGNKNRATLAVARQMVAYLLAVDKRRSRFIAKEQPSAA